MALEPGSSRQKGKRTKAGVLVSSITLEDLETCFHLPTEHACVKLGVGLTILKRLCRRFGIARWPYRTLLKEGKASRHLPAAQSRGPPARSPRPDCGTPPSGGRRTKPASSWQPCDSAHTSLSNSTLVLRAGGSESSDLPTTVVTHEWAAPLPLPPPPSLPAAADAALASLAAAQPAPGAAGAASPQQQQSPRKRKAPASFADLQHKPPGCFGQPASSQPPEPEQDAAQRPAKRPAAKLPASGSQMSLLLSAIEACERTGPAPSPTTPLQEEQAWAPFTQGGRLPPASAFRARPFRHSQRSAFSPLRMLEATPSEAAQLLPLGTLDARAQLQALVKTQLQALTERRAAGRAARPAATLMKLLAGAATEAGGADTRKRLLLAQKLLLVRAALQARIARKREALLGAQQQPPEAAAVVAGPTLQDIETAASGPVPIAALPPSNLLDGLSSSDAAALHSARSLLAQF